MSKMPDEKMQEKQRGETTLYGVDLISQLLVCAV